MAQRMDPTITVVSEVGDGLVQASCVDCGDIGWVRKNLPVTDKDFGKMSPCHCRVLQATDRYMSALAGVEVHRAYTFETFRTDWPESIVGPRHNASAAKAKRAAMAWVDGSGPPWLVLEASTRGCGKSHLALAAVREFLLKRMSVCYYLTTEYLDLLKTGYSGDENAKALGNNARERVMTSDVLILDDYGMQRDTGWATEVLEADLSFRYQRQLRTCLTTNDLSKGSERIVSRASDAEKCALIVMDGASDVRPLLGAR